MTSVGELLAGLPMPVGPIVTGALPIIALAAIAAATYSLRKGRRTTAVVLLVVGIGALIGAVSFYAYISPHD